MMDKLGIPMPESGMASNIDDAVKVANAIGYPLMIRPSFVLGGRGMEVIYDEAMLREYVAKAVGVTEDRPLLLDRFLQHALECEADAVSDGEHVFIPAVMEHVELAGVHSGDSACIIPSANIPEDCLETIRDYTQKIAKALKVCGLMNMQYAIEDGKVYVLEANPRASRTVPLVSKVCAIQMAAAATRLMLGADFAAIGLRHGKIPYYGAKEAICPFDKFPEVDPVLGPEMRSTGEVLGLARDPALAFCKSQEAANAPLPEKEAPSWPPSPSRTTNPPLRSRPSPISASSSTPPPAPSASLTPPASRARPSRRLGRAAPTSSTSSSTARSTSSSTPPAPAATRRPTAPPSARQPSNTACPT